MAVTNWAGVNNVIDMFENTTTKKILKIIGTKHGTVLKNDARM